MSFLVPLADLNRFQKEAAHSVGRYDVIIHGGKLSGKTLTLLHRAAYLLSEFSKDRQRINSTLQIWVCSEGQRDLLRSVAPLLQIPPSRIECYDDWCRRVYEQVVDASLPHIPLIGGIDFALIRIVVERAIQWGLAPQPDFDVLLVDESEGFSPADIELMVKSSRHITFTADGEEQATSLGRALAEAKRPISKFVLPKSYERSCALAALCAHLRSHDGDPRSKQHIGSEESGEEASSFFFAPDEETEIAHLDEVLRERMFNNDSVAILQPRWKEAIALAAAVQARGIGVEVASNPITTRFPTPNFATNQPKIFTFDSARTLRFDSVLIPRLSERHYRGYSEMDVRIQLSEAVGRAKKWVYLSTETSCALPQLGSLEQCRPDLLCVTDARKHASPSRGRTETETPPYAPHTLLDELL